MVTPHFYLNHTFMLGTNIPHIPANAMYDFSTQIVLPGNQLVVAHLAPGGGVDGRCVALTQHKASRPAPRVRTDISHAPPADITWALGRTRWRSSRRTCSQMLRRTLSA